MQDHARAAEEYLRAYHIDPKESQIILELARVLMYVHKYDDAEDIIRKIHKHSALTAVMKRKAFDLELQIYQRHADYSCKQRDPLKALQLLKKFDSVFKLSSHDVRDSYILDTLRRALTIGKRIWALIQEPDAKENAKNLVASLEEDHRTMGVNVTAVKRVKGTIDRIPDGKRYGFIIAEDGRRYFFHFGSLINVYSTDLLEAGYEVSFDPANGSEGPVALNCEVLFDILKH